MNAVSVPANQDDVVRLDVPVNEPEAVGQRQNRAHLTDEALRLRERERPLGFEPRLEADPVEQLHHDERCPVRHRSEIEDLRHVRALEAPDRPRLEGEALKRCRVLGQRPGEKLDGHFALGSAQRRETPTRPGPFHP